ncbi:MMPL family transporter [Corynebacterium sanguinis]|uniref:MMPL family transporter n=1 Tax=Corynebacterium sanguinis TaxID=2594913 RepID=UPI00119E7BC5|nr:MMPL family transporter [Corynebacterium sanguinis]MCT2024331.1 MMPL family transporter [Corynebacterium sanguinis]MCT2047983.1 MMPL family transporter [Corynebacterium sanguinis]TVS26647.1 MMPL family transporter [Corynebacterium sanguinis]
MAKFLFQVGRWSYLHKWQVIIAWLLILAGTAGAAFTLSKPFTSEFAISGTPAIEALNTLDANFPGTGDIANAPTVNLVFAAPEGKRLDSPENMEAIDATVGYIADNLEGITATERFGNPVEVNEELTRTIVGQMTEMGLPAEAAKADAYNVRTLSDDARIGFTTFNFGAESAMTVTQEERDVVNAAMDIGRDAGLQVEAGGPGFGEPIEIKTTSELIGLGVAFIVLLLTFGSLVAASMPVVTAVIGVGIGALLILVATRFAELNEITPVLAVMIGLAVGIDYALFILSRYRQERKHLPAADAAGLATGTAGSSVVFAGLTVFTALIALALAQIEFLTWMGLAAAVTVAISVLIALTLIPALLGAWGDRSFGVKLPGVAGNPGPGKRPAKDLTERSMGRSWVSLVQRFPALVMAVVVLGLGALSIPVLNLQMALPSDTTSNLDTTQRKSAEMIAEGFGPGVNGQFLVVVDAHNVNPDAAILQPFMDSMPDEVGGDAEKAALASFLYTVSEAKSVNGIRHAQLVAVNDDLTAAQIAATPTAGPEQEFTLDVAHGLRETNNRVEDATGVTIGLTGLTAVQMDITEKLASAMPLYLGIVVGLAIILLILVFRSIMVPLVAGLGFLLSVGAAFGVTIAVFQMGAFGLVDTPAPIISFMPIFLIGVTFGLAMDYQVFLVTRIREHYLKHRGGPGGELRAVEESTVEGFAQGARVVTAAAVIMIAVFVAFVDQPLPFIQIFGFALAAAVLFDAFFIRMTLVPATMFILGRATWWMPRWLDRILPEVDVEGTELEKEFEHA